MEDGEELLQVGLKQQVVAEDLLHHEGSSWGVRKTTRRKKKDGKVEKKYD